MKSSIYNLYIPMKTGDFLLYNTLNRTQLIGDLELKDLLENNSIEDIGKNYSSKLKDWGFIVDKTLDEKRIYSMQHNMAKYCSDVSSFLVFPTYSCNLSCPYCYEKEVGVPQSKSMDRDVVTRTVDFIKNLSLQNHSSSVVLGLYGGEPLLKPDVCFKISEAISNWSNEKKLTYFCSLTTNGTLLSEDVYEKLYPFISSIHFTLDGPRDMHNTKRFYSNGNGTYDDIMRAISLVRESDMHLTIRIHVDEKDYNKYLKIVLGDLEKLGLKDRPRTYLYFMPVKPPNTCIIFSDHEDDMIKSLHKSIEQTPEFWNIAKRLGWGKLLHVDAGQEHSSMSHSPLPCGFIKKGCYVIDPSAELYLCPSVAGMREYSVGTINADGTPEWNESYYSMITRNPVDIKQCRDCELLPICSGGCPVKVHRKSLTYRGSYCSHLKDTHIKKIISYFKYKYPEKFEGRF